MAQALQMLVEQSSGNGGSVNDDIQVLIHKRKPGLAAAYRTHNVSHLAEVVREARFVEYQRSLSRCDIILPLITPTLNAAYFHNETKSLRKLSGFVSQAIGYSVPTVLHQDLYEIYQDHWTAPSTTYQDDDPASLVQALLQMVEQLRQNRTNTPPSPEH